MLAELDPLTRILFSGLWCIADREGRLEDRPKRIKADVLPYDECDIDAMLDDLASAGFIQRYTVENVEYIAILAFSKHQNPHKNEADSTIPAPTGETDSGSDTEQHSTSTVQAPDKHTTNPADSGFLIPDSLIPDTGSSLAPAKPSRKSAEPRARPRNETWDALAALCGEPETTSEKSDFGKTVKELREANATPQEIAAFGPWWFEKHPDAELTHHCLRRHLGRFRNQPERPPPPVSSIRNPMVRAALTTDLSDIRAELESKRDRRNEIQGPFSGPRELPAES